MSNLWDRQPREPMNWFERFERFRLAGANRSMLAIYKAEKAVTDAAKGKPYKEPKTLPKQWRDLSSKWRWRERAEAWDAHLIEIRREEEAKRLAEEQEIARQFRRQSVQSMGILLTNLIEKMANTVENYGKMKEGRPAYMDGREINYIASAIATITKLSRLEFGEPTDITHSTVDSHDWRDRAIADIKAGEIKFEALAEAFDEDLAAELFKLAGVPVE